MPEDLFGFNQEEAEQTPEPEASKPAKPTAAADQEEAKQQPEPKAPKPAKPTAAAAAQEEAKQQPEPKAPKPAKPTAAAAAQEEAKQPPEPKASKPAKPTVAAADQEEAKQPPEPKASKPAKPTAAAAAQEEAKQQPEPKASKPAKPTAAAAAQEEAKQPPEPKASKPAKPTTAAIPPEAAAPHFWQQQAWDRLKQRLDKLPHALLLHAPGGYAIEDFARLLCRSILVTGADHKRQAALFDSGNHPELTVINPEGKTIGIDDVREGISWLGLRSMDAGQRRLLVLHEADRMSRGAANALLKCLEEAPGNGLILLLSAKPHGLPATVISRCVKVPLFHAEAGQVREWLHSKLPPDQHTAANMLLLAGYGPTMVLQHLDQKGSETKTMVFRFFTGKAASQPVPELAKSWQAVGTDRALLWMRAMLFAAIREQLGDASIGAGLAGRLAVSDLRQLLDFYSQVTQHEHLYHSQSGISEVALLEALILRWLGLRATP